MSVIAIPGFLLTEVRPVPWLQAFVEVLPPTPPAVPVGESWSDEPLDEATYQRAIERLEREGQQDTRAAMARLNKGARMPMPGPSRLPFDIEPRPRHRAAR